MNCSINVDAKTFVRDLKHITKKFPEIYPEIERHLETIKNNPQKGIELQWPNISAHPVYKLKLPIKCANIGKSGGLRLIYIYIINDKHLIPFSYTTKAKKTI